MQQTIKCESWDKPGKYEVVRQIIDWSRVVKDCPDCDRKRTTACKDPACSRVKPH